GALPRRRHLALSPVARQLADLVHARAPVRRHAAARAITAVAPVAGMTQAPHGDSHWAAQRERGSFALMKFTVRALQLLGRRAITPLLYLIVLYFYLFGRSARQSAWTYQRHLANWSGRGELTPSARSLFRQFMAFADALLDKIDVWGGRIGFDQLDVDDPHGIRAQIWAGGQRGQMLVGAHLGNLEVCRALAEMGGKVKMSILVHTRHAERFNRLLEESG